METRNNLVNNSWSDQVKYLEKGNHKEKKKILMKKEFSTFHWLTSISHRDMQLLPQRQLK